MFLIVDMLNRVPQMFINHLDVFGKKDLRVEYDKHGAAFWERKFEVVKGHSVSDGVIFSINPDGSLVREVDYFLNELAGEKFADKQCEIYAFRIGENKIIVTNEIYDLCVESLTFSYDGTHLVVRNQARPPESPTSNFCVFSFDKEMLLTKSVNISEPPIYQSLQQVFPFELVQKIFEFVIFQEEYSLFEYLTYYDAHSALLREDIVRHNYIKDLHRNKSKHHGLKFLFQYYYPGSKYSRSTIDKVCPHPLVKKQIKYVGEVTQHSIFPFGKLCHGSFKICLEYGIDLTNVVPGSRLEACVFLKEYDSDIEKYVPLERAEAIRNMFSDYYRSYVWVKIPFMHLIVFIQIYKNERYPDDRFRNKANSEHSYRQALLLAYDLPEK